MHLLRCLYVKNVENWVGATSYYAQLFLKMEGLCVSRSDETFTLNVMDKVKVCLKEISYVLHVLKSLRTEQTSVLLFPVLSGLFAPDDSWFMSPLV